LPPQDPQTFFDLFQETHPVPEGTHQYSTLDLDEIHTVDAAEESFRDLIDALFVRSWSAYLDAKDKNQRQLELQEYVESQLKERATAPVAMDIDQITTDSPELADAVKAQVAKQIKSLQTQVSRLTNKLNETKNMPSGAPRSRAQPKKKKDPAPRAVKPPPAGPKAAGAARDTPAVTPRHPRGKTNRPRRNKSRPQNSSS
jgi:hypothetical protein